MISRALIIFILMALPGSGIFILIIDIAVIAFGIAMCVHDVRSKHVGSALIVAVFVMIVIAAPMVPELRQIILLYYRYQISTIEKYAARCQPDAGVPTNGAKIRVCDERGWGYRNENMALIKVDGDPRSVTDNALSRPRSGSEDPLERIGLPFGIIKYDDVRVKDNYYLIFFEDTPVTTADK